MLLRPHMSTRRFYFYAFSLLATALSSCTPLAELPEADKDNGGLFLPGGFEAVVVADSTGRARHIAVNDNGDIYVKLVFSDSRFGGNVALRDTTGDGRADVIVNFGGTEQKRTSYGTGMMIHNGYLYYSSATVIYRNKLTPGKL